MDNRRKTIVINKKFQYQYSLLVAALSVLLVNGFFMARLLFPGTSPLDISTPALVGIGLLELMLVCGIWYFSLRISHRIAGPVHVFQREINRMGSGDLTARIALRETDMFREEAQEINASIATLAGKLQSIKSLVDRLEGLLPRDGDTGALLSELQKELSTFRTEEREG